MTNNENSVNDLKSYLKKGFWIPFGAICGIAVITIGIGSIFILGLYQREVFGKLGYSWNELWYSKEQKRFIECWKKEYSYYMNTPFPNLNHKDFIIPKTPTKICMEKGFKPFPPYNKEDVE
jgi:hypothetical protein